MNSRYFKIDQIQSFKFPQKENSLSFFHNNASSLNKNFDGLVYLLKCTNKTFDLIGVDDDIASGRFSLGLT